MTSCPADITVTDRLIPSDTPGIELFLRNKRKASNGARSSLLLVHGATFPSVSLFDVDVDGLSFMDSLAHAGFDVWALDIRGYGGSTRLDGMKAAPSAGTPLVRATEALRDVARAMAHVRAERSPERLGLLGMSWGGSVAGLYASQHPSALDALILVAPLWLSAAPLRFDNGTTIFTHREVDVSAYKTAWLAAVPKSERNDQVPASWFERWAEITAATDGAAGRGYLRAPSGAVADVREHWTAGRPLYEPASIAAPTLILRGTWDVDVRRDMALDLFDRLSGAKQRAYVEIASGTHMLLMEPVRQTVFGQIAAFLASAFAIAGANN
jgi:alpha-beta hydrolase superfamily lysophospholipase